MKGFNKKIVSSHKSSLHTLIIQVAKQFVSNYISDESSFDKRIINNIIYNEKSHCVALFKDYLLLDDSTEFLKRYYSKNDAKERLNRFFEYYESYSKIFPNYTSIFEGKYIYCNIQKKQKMIDLQERMELEVNTKREKNPTNNSDEVFSTDVYDSIINDRNNEDLEMILNLNEHSIDFYDKIEVMISDIEKNDTNSNYNHNHNNSNQSIAVHEKPAVSKHKMLISSLLGRNQYVNVNNKNGFIQIKDKQIFISYHNSCDSIGESKVINSRIPLTDRLSSKNKTNENDNANLNGYKGKNPRQFSKTKLLSNYPKTIIIDNTAIKKIRNKEDASTAPLTQRENFKFKYNELALTQLKEYNERKKKSHRMYIKTPPKFANNFTYMVNPHSKITTHVTLCNNNNNSSITSTKNTVNTQQLTGRTSSNVQSKVSSKRPSATFQCKRNLHTNGVNVECLTGRTRNTKQTINNNLMLKTSRDQGNKNLNLLRTASQTSMPINQNDKYYTSKYTMKQNTKSRPASTNRTRSISNHKPNKANNVPANKNEPRRKKLAPNINQSVHHQNQPKNQIVKGIHIHNFSKVFSINCSQAASTSLEKKHNQR